MSKTEKAQWFEKADLFFQTPLFCFIQYCKKCTHSHLLAMVKLNLIHTTYLLLKFYLFFIFIYFQGSNQWIQQSSQKFICSWEVMERLLSQWGSNGRKIQKFSQPLQWPTYRGLLQVCEEHFSPQKLSTMGWRLESIKRLPWLGRLRHIAEPHSLKS